MDYSKLKLLVVVLVFVCGCTVKTQIIKPDGSVYTIHSKSDAMVTMKSKNVDITVDNRGQPNIFHSLLGWLLLETPKTINTD